MIESFVLSINVTFPFVALALLGLFMRRIGFIDSNFVKQSNKILFYFAIPTTIFIHIHRADLSYIFDMRFILFNVIWLIVFFIATWFLAAKFMSKVDCISSFVNSAYRSSLSVVAPPLFLLLFYGVENDNLRAQSLLALSLLLIISYATAAILFAVQDVKEKQSDNGSVLKDIFMSILKNPIIWGVIAGISFNLLGFRALPVAINSTLTNLANIVMPLAMICVGANLRFHGFDKKFKYVIISVVVKLFIMPISAVLVAHLFGFRGNDLTIIMILNALPMAVGAYVMQAELGSGDLYIGASTLMITMVLSAFTLTLFIFLFRLAGILV